jgi:hypothetical protein
MTFFFCWLLLRQTLLKRPLYTVESYSKIIWHTYSAYTMAPTGFFPFFFLSGNVVDGLIYLHKDRHIIHRFRV